MINGGYYIKARKIQNSPVHKQPPHVREIWDYLLREANHRDNKYGKYEVKRGQLFRTYSEIREDLSWFVGWRKQMYSENQTKKAMKALREERMIATQKAPGGVLITVLNYEYYQDPKNYESTTESTTESTWKEPLKNQCGTTNNKNDKKEKNEKNEKKYNGKFRPPTVDEVREYCQQRNNGIDAQYWVDSYTAKGWVVGTNKTPMKDWKAAIRTWEKSNIKKKSDTCIPSGAENAI